MPGLVDRRTLRGADRDYDQAQREVHGPTYQIQPSEQRQEGDPLHGIIQQIVLPEPPEYQHPRPLGRDVGMSREEAFEQAQRAAAAETAFLYGLSGFKDRRYEGRRFRGTDWITELDGPQESNRVSGWQRDEDPSKYLQGW
jgi:hypothetical protein